MAERGGPRITRRGFLGGLAGAALLAACGDDKERAKSKEADGAGLRVPKGLRGPLFTLGTASGDPRPDRVILWTRLAPDEGAGGALPNAKVPVRWQVATDEQMRQVVRTGTAIADPSWAHSVHVDATGLAPGRDYWYRFVVGDHESAVARTRTAPAPGATGSRAEELRFAFASCQHWESGYFGAYRQMAQEELDLVVHLGDYIYEYGPARYPDAQVRRPLPVASEATDLAGYREQWAAYKSDPDLQAAHAIAPWIVAWDDHEVENNYAGKQSDSGDDPTAFLRRRAAAYQAFYEHQPIRATPPAGPSMTAHRRVAWGDLATFHMLDTRQHRSDQACGRESDIGPACAAVADPERTLLGAEQERWLARGFRESSARWDVLAQQVILAPFNIAPEAPDGLFNLDQWDGYTAARRRLYDALHAGKVENPVVITGDIHASAVFDLLDAGRAGGPAVPIGTELVGPSITSPFPEAFVPLVEAAASRNPGARYLEGRKHGYVLCDVTADTLRADYRYIETLDRADTPIATGASFVIEAGHPGAKQV